MTARKDPIICHNLMLIYRNEQEITKHIKAIAVEEETR